MATPTDWGGHLFVSFDSSYLDGAFGEPEGELARCRIWIAAAMGQVIVDGEGKVAADRAGGGFHGIGGTHHGSDGFHGVVALDRHGNDRARGQIVDDAAKERTLAVLIVVSFHGLTGSIDELEADDLQVAALYARGDFADEVALYAARLDEDKGCFHLCDQSLPVGYP